MTKKEEIVEENWYDFAGYRTYVHETIHADVHQFWFRVLTSDSEQYSGSPRNYSGKWGFEIVDPVDDPITAEQFGKLMEKGKEFVEDGEEEFNIPEGTEFPRVSQYIDD